MDYWQERNNQQFQLFSSKFSYHLERFCIENKFGHRTNFNEIKSVKKLIELNLPVNLDNISITEIINFRNRERYQKRLRAFRLAVYELNNLKDGGLTESNYYEIIKHIEETKSGVFNDLLELSTILTQVGLGVFLAISNHSGSLEMIKESVGSGLIISGINNFGNKVRDPHGQAIKYITEIRNFKSRRFTRTRML